MSASITDKITDVRNAARPVTARVITERTAAGTTLHCNGLTGWPTVSKVHFVTYQIDTNNDPVAGTQLDCYGIVSGSDITNFTVVDGTDGGNSIGDVVEMLPTAAWGQDLADALMVSHDRTGTINSTALALIGAAMYPVGSIYVNATVSTNPATLLGFGTWTAFGSGRVMVGVDAGQTEFDTLGETGGAKTHTLVASELPPIDGFMPNGTGSLTLNDRSADKVLVTDNAVQAVNGENVSRPYGGVVGTSSSQAHNNLQPYITVYMWKRTA